jgi:hypothetical protein
LKAASKRDARFEGITQSTLITWRTMTDVGHHVGEAAAEAGSSTTGSADSEVCVLRSHMNRITD